jgi:hypothetical protein
VDYEHDFGHQIVLDIAYVGLKGEHLQAAAGVDDNGVGLDQLSSGYFICGTDKTQPQCGGHLLLDQVSNPFFGLVASSSSMSGATIPAGQLLRPYPQYYNLRNPANAGSYVLYNGLQAKVQKRFGAGGNLLLSYTYGNSNGNADGTTLFMGVQTGYTQDYTNPKGEVSQLSYNIPQMLIGSYVIDLPIGRGQRFLQHPNGFADKLISGWGIDGITAYRAGYPVALSEQPTALSSNFGAGYPRPNVTAGCKATNSTGSAASRLNKWFNTSCFTQTSNFSFGNEPRIDPNIRQQGAANWDISAVKKTAIGEGIDLEFRAEMFNAFNHVQFQVPNGTCCSDTNPTFGVVSSQNNNPRQFQFALKASF